MSDMNTKLEDAVLVAFERACEEQDWTVADICCVPLKPFRRVMATVSSYSMPSCALLTPPSDLPGIHASQDRMK
jgi:hypothetical protein